MKYNRSEIMKNAWEIRRSYNARGLTFGECLKRAWEKAKTAIANAAQLAAMTGKKFVNGMEITFDGYTRTLSRWTKGGMDRVYINGGSRRGEGYIDLNTRRAYTNSSTYVNKMVEAILTMEF